MTTTAARPDVLQAIVAATRQRVATARKQVTADDWLARATRRPAGHLFREALATSTSVRVIAECKRRSPSRGVLRAAYDPVAIARGYAAAGAAAISVLTEPSFFDGALDHLRDVRAAVDTPLLRKDFIVDEYQLAEAVAAGADAVLLIVAALDDVALRHLRESAEAHGLAVLVEAHDDEEVDRAIATGATIVGINNRSLRTLEVDVRLSERVAPRLPASVIRVSESGLRTIDDLGRLMALGYRAFLMGERFMTTPDPGAALAALLAEARR